MVRRATLLATVLLLLLSALPAAAADGCPASSSGFEPGDVNWEWEPGDAVPTDDELWNVTVLEGAAAEGLTIEELTELAGFASVEEFYAFALGGWRELDKNMDGVICYKPIAEQGQGFPAYFSNFVDSNAKAWK